MGTCPNELPESLGLAPRAGGVQRDKRCRLPALLLVSLVVCAGCTGWRDYLANGCKVGPNYCPPAAPVAEQWIEARDPAVNTAQSSEPAWWCSFNDPVLNTLVETAYRQNLTVRIAGLRVLEARAQRTMVAGDLWPQQQELFGDYRRNQISANSTTGGFLADRSYSNWRLGANLAWELDFWGRFRRAVESADANLDAAVANYDDVLVILLADVAQAYTNVRIAEQRLAFAAQNVKTQEGSLRIAKDRLNQGATTRLDVTQGLSNLAQTEASIRPLESARRQAINQLCILMGLPPQDLDALLSAHRGIPTAPPQVAIGIPAELLRRRPDVRRAEREVAAQSALIGVATSELYPHFTINGTLFLDAVKFSDLFDANSLAGSVGPSFRWDILNYGRLSANIAIHEARFLQRAAQYQNTVLQANAEAENALIGFLKAQQQARSLLESANAAQESVKLVTHQYHEGKVDFNRVFNVELFLTQQQDQLALVQGAVAQNLIQLYRALGGGWQIRLCPAAPQQPPETLPAPPAQPLAPPQRLPPAQRPS